MMWKCGYFLFDTQRTPTYTSTTKNKALSEKSNQMRMAEKERYGRNVIDNGGTAEEIRRPLEENLQERQEKGDD